MAENEKTTAVLNPRSTLELAIEKGLDPATIGKMMDLQERWEAGRARKEYVEAMAGFKRECPAVIGKDRRADFGAGKAKYSYATTGAIVTAITPALSKFGLSLSWETSQKERQVTVTCHVTHSGGHRESAALTGPHDESGGKNPIQTLGSSVHYLQRYTMVSVLGLATADMDDPDANPQRPPVGMPVETPASAPAPSSETHIELDEKIVTGQIEAISVKESAPGASKPWKKYGVKIGQEWYATFDAAVGAAAVKGANVTIAFVTNAKGYHDIVALQPAGQSADAPEERGDANEGEPTTIEKIGINWQELGFPEGRLLTLLRKDKLISEFGKLDDLEPNQAEAVLAKLGVYASRCK
jgi:hypothetical protein